MSRRILVHDNGGSLVRHGGGRSSMRAPKELVIVWWMRVMC